MAWVTWKIAGRAFVATSLAALLLVIVNKWESAVEWKTKAEHYVETMLGMARTVEAQKEQTQILIEAVNGLTKRERQTDAVFAELIRATEDDSVTECDVVRLSPSYVGRLRDGAEAASGDSGGVPGDSRSVDHADADSGNRAADVR